jgi:hypothetical protein
VWVQIPLSAPKKENRMKNKNKRKYRLKGLNILVRNDVESKFVIDLAWRYGYEWRERRKNSKAYKKPSTSVYKKEKGKDGSFIYCFDYEPELEEFKLSFFSLTDYDEQENLESMIKEFELEIYEASELMEMSKESLDLFLRLK